MIWNAVITGPFPDGTGLPVVVAAAVVVAALGVVVVGVGRHDATPAMAATATTAAPARAISRIRFDGAGSGGGASFEAAPSAKSRVGCSEPDRSGSGATGDVDTPGSKPIFQRISRPPAVWLVRKSPLGHIDKL
jgi:hypothetical protein